MKNKAVSLYRITNHRIVIQLHYDFSRHLSLRSLAVNFVLVADSEVSMVTAHRILKETLEQGNSYCHHLPKM